MVQRGISFFLLLCFSSAWAAVGDEKIFDQATALYKQGQFEQALEMYSKIVDQDRSVAFNQGNCAFKLGRHGQALLFWRRAERDWGLWNRQELNDNIALVKRAGALAPKHADQSPLRALQESAKAIKNSYLSFVRATPLLFFQLLFLFLWLISFVVLKWFKRSRRGVVTFFVAVVYASVAMLLVSKYSMAYSTYGVVTAKQVSLYSGPGESYQALGTLCEAQEVVIQRESDGYYKIKATPLFGWVNKNSVGVV